MTLYLGQQLCRRAIHLTRSANPHKLILIHNEHRNAITRSLSERIQRELRQAHLNALATDKMISSPQVPYTVVITERTLTDGVVQLKHYKPRIDEEVHVSELPARLSMQFGAVQELGQ